MALRFVDRYRRLMPRLAKTFQLERKAAARREKERERSQQRGRKRRGTDPFCVSYIKREVYIGRIRVSSFRFGLHDRALIGKSIRY